MGIARGCDVDEDSLALPHELSDDKYNQCNSAKRCQCRYQDRRDTCPRAARLRGCQWAGRHGDSRLAWGVDEDRICGQWGVRVITGTAVAERRSAQRWTFSPTRTGCNHDIAHLLHDAQPTCHRAECISPPVTHDAIDFAVTKRGVVRQTLADTM
jgi:hypothetical protein